MPLYLGVGSLVPRLFSEKKSAQFYSDYDAASAFTQLSPQWKLTTSVNVIYTPINKEYLTWRFAECPIAQYGAIIEPNQFGIVFRLKKRNRFIELRICEVWTENKKAEKLLNKAFRKLVKKIRPVLVSCAETPFLQTDKKRPLGLFGPFKKGPVTTLKPLSRNKLNNFDNFIQWSPSIGAMELF
jgi:hypothetical protein